MTFLCLWCAPLAVPGSGGGAGQELWFGMGRPTSHESTFLAISYKQEMWTGPKFAPNRALLNEECFILVVWVRFLASQRQGRGPGLSVPHGRPEAHAHAPRSVPWPLLMPPSHPQAFGPLVPRAFVLCSAGSPCHLLYVEASFPCCSRSQSIQDRFLFLPQKIYSV